MKRVIAAAALVLAALLPAASPVSAHTGTCNFTDLNWNGAEASSSQINVWGVKATINSNNGLCSGSGDPLPPGIPHVSMTFISLQARDLNIGGADSSRVMMGIERYDANNTKAFWGEGGCGSATTWTQHIIGSVTPGTSHTFKIERTADLTHFTLTFDGILFADTPSAVSCWSDLQLNARWLGERAYEWDSFGSSAHPTTVTGMQYKTSSGGSYVNETGTTCEWDGSGGFLSNPTTCSKSGSSLTLYD